MRFAFLVFFLIFISLSYLFIRNADNSIQETPTKAEKTLTKIELKLPQDKFLKLDINSIKELKPTYAKYST